MTNREIKFRVFNEFSDIHNKMLVVNQLSWQKHEDGIVRAHFKGSSEFGSHEGVCSGFGKADFSEDYGWKLMQYTGLKDSNNVEIYEGDIVSGYIPDSEREINLPIGVVKFDEGQFGIFINSRYRKSSAFLYDEYLGDLATCALNGSIEVIGNIYENPTMIEDYIKKEEENQRENKLIWLEKEINELTDRLNEKEIELEKLKINEP